MFTSGSRGNCLWCEEEILPGDENPHTPGMPMHLECGMRTVLGSVGHHRQRCSCYGGTEDDPPGVSKRDAARLAVVQFFANNAEAWRPWSIARRVRLRPTNFNDLAVEERWRIDKALHLLDWDGKEGLQ